MTTSLSPSLRTFSNTRFQLCVSLIETMRSHSRLLDELDQLRELRRRGLVYREGIHSGRQIAEVYLIRQERKIAETLARLEATRKTAYALMERADAIEACESTSRQRFTSRLSRRQLPLVPSMATGLGQMSATL